MNLDPYEKERFLASCLPKNPKLGEIHFISKLTWQLGVIELEKYLPKDWKNTGSIGIGWTLKYEPSE